MASHQFGGLTAHFTQAGAGPDIVLLHAGGSSGAQWRKSAALLERNFRLTMPDFIGFGRSDVWPGHRDLSHDDQAAMAASIVKSVCETPVCIVGHSYGGAVAVRLALLYPEIVATLVLIEPVLTPLLKLDGKNKIFEEYRDLAETFLSRGRNGDDEAAWQGFIDYRNGAGSWASLPDKAREKFLSGTRQTMDAFISNLGNPTSLEECRSISLPTLVLCGEKTTEPDRVVTEILHREIRNARYRILEGAEHMSPLTHPELLAGIIQDFCLEISG